MALFNLFRKDKPEDLMAFLKQGVPGGGEGPEARVRQTAQAQAQAAIEVEETGGGLAPELEEAAVLYANGKTGDAAALLNRYLLDHPDLRDPQPWYMLFDLYEATGQSAPFEDAAVEFAVRFERSPPTWSPRVLQSGGEEAAMPYMGFGAQFGPADRERLKRFLQEAQARPAVRVDVGRTPAPDEDYARVILECLTRLQEEGKAIQLTGAPSLIAHLQAQRDADRLSEPGWLLLLTLLQLSADEARFEELALDYAVRFEVSPPSYTPPKAPAQPDPRSGVPRPEPSGLSFPLYGVVGARGDDQLARLRAFAEDKPQVEIDLSRVSRIEFASVGLLLETLIALQEKGCKVLFKEGNELVNVLLQLIGAAQYAVILGRTRV
ncbi:MAG: STAS domain-containing protein [Thiobacillaceae bacterium]|nr:STAS domain-containing protein [Thiobacillaceae bacterium]MCX7674179.1 STAS domain-containing protein [Thiobacillaceae bacterium]MDW8322883.1 STAS domain-containing protein [Burkholderiales bacterium]